MYSHNHGWKHKENSRKNSPRLHMGTATESACIDCKDSVESQTTWLQRTLPIRVQIIKAIVVLPWRVHILQWGPYISKILGFGTEARIWTLHPKQNPWPVVSAADWTSLLCLECNLTTFRLLFKTLLRYSLGRLGESPCWDWDARLDSPIPLRYKGVPEKNSDILTIFPIKGMFFSVQIELHADVVEFGRHASLRC